jgi:hypothetical protein
MVFKECDGCVINNDVCMYETQQRMYQLEDSTGLGQVVVLPSCGCIS